MESETSDIKGHLVETKTSCYQIETAPSYIEYHQSPSKPEKRLVPNWEQTVASYLVRSSGSRIVLIEASREDAPIQNERLRIHLILSRNANLLPLNAPLWFRITL